MQAVSHNASRQAAGPNKRTNLASALFMIENINVIKKMYIFEYLILRSKEISSFL